MTTDENVIEILSKCYNFAAIKHTNQRRLDSDKTPYINHPIGLCIINDFQKKSNLIIK